MALAYLDQDCTQTLREALDAYYAGIDGLITEDNAEKWVADLFRSHDIGHVVFGCDTTVRGEPLADLFCIFGTDCTLREYLRYAELPEAKAVFVEAGFVTMVTATVLSVPGMLLSLWRSFRMREPWPFWDNDAWLDTPLNEIRERFGIRVIPH